MSDNLRKALRRGLEDARAEFSGTPGLSATLLLLLILTAALMVALFAAALVMGVIEYGWPIVIAYLVIGRVWYAVWRWLREG